MRRRRPRPFSLLLAGALAAGLLVAIPAGPAAASVAAAAQSSAAQSSAARSVATRSVAAQLSVSSATRWVGVSAVLGAGRLRLSGAFADRSAGVLSESSAGRFSDATRMTGSFTGTSLVYSTGRYDMFAIGTDHRLRHRSNTRGKWSAWSMVGSGRYLGTPAAIRAGSGALWVVAVGINHSVYLVTKYGSSVSAPTRLGGTHVTGAPAITYQSSGYQIDVFWTTGGGVVQRRSMRGKHWGAISEVTRGFKSGIGAVRTSDGGFRLVTTRADRHVYLIASTRTGWAKPNQIGGSVVGSPALTYDRARQRMDVVAVGANGVLQYRSNVKGRWGSWKAVRTRIPVTAPADPAKVLLARWGGALTGLPGVLSDLRTAAAGGTIASPCGTRVRLNPRLLTLLVAVTDRYHVMVNNLVTGHGCDSGRHPRGGAVDVNIVTDPRTGARTNLHSGGSGDNDTLDRQFVSFLATKLPAGGGLGQRYCGSRGSATVPTSILFFSDTCNHQHAQVATS
jgi:hypothetical protein